MTALHAFLRKIDAIENIGGECPREITLHPADLADLKAECFSGSCWIEPAAPSENPAPPYALKVVGVLVSTDPLQTRLPRRP